jgi:3-hydroxy acid dehydrogenase/malonic semialdehyde reductase
MTEQWAKGRIALVTGATSGFGLALANGLVAAGGQVIAVGRRQERLDALRDELGAAQLFPLALDVRDEAAVTALFERLPENFRAIDTLINNAGLALGLDPAHRAAWSDWATMIDTNVTALVRLTHTLLPHLTAQGRGDIVNVSSVAASYPYPGGNVYGATKAFVRQFSLNLRADLLGTGVRVTSIEPGMCETEFSAVRFRGDEAAAANVYRGMTPLSADDVAEVILGALKLPRHININTIELMPIAQAFGPFAVHRT